MSLQDLLACIRPALYALLQDRCSAYPLWMKLLGHIERPGARN